MAKRIRKHVLESAFGETIKAEARRTLGKQGAKLVAKHASKGTAKVIARTATSPWLLAADGVEIAAKRAAAALDCSPDDAKLIGRGAGLATSVGVGTAVGGPIGAAAGAALWGVGALVDWILD